MVRQPEPLPCGITYRHRRIENRMGMYAALHSHNQFELIYLISGDVAHVIEGKKYLLRPGDLVLVRPSKYHYLQILSDAAYERYNVLFDPVQHGIKSALALPEDADVICLSEHPLAQELFSKMDHYSQAPTEDFEQLLKLLLNELFISLRIAPKLQVQEQTLLSPVLTQALEYINGHLFTIGSVEEVAEALFISPSYLFHLFRNSLHQSPKKYINDKRLLAAQRRILNGERPSTVYKECGFREYAAFYRSYCTFFGHAPSQDKPII